MFDEKANKAYEHKHIMSSIKHGGGRVMIWASWKAENKSLLNHACRKMICWNFAEYLLAQESEAKQPLIKICPKLKLNAKLLFLNAYMSK